jgi:hypothetical protein
MDVKILPEQNKLIITGDVKFDLIYNSNVCDHISVVRPFKMERECADLHEDAYCDYNVSVQSYNAIFEKGKIHLTAELYFNVLCADFINDRYIKSAEFRV